MSRPPMPSPAEYNSQLAASQAVGAGGMSSGGPGSMGANNQGLELVQGGGIGDPIGQGFAAGNILGAKSMDEAAKEAFNNPGGLFASMVGNGQVGSAFTAMGEMQAGGQGLSISNFNIASQISPPDGVGVISGLDKAQQHLK